MRRATSLLLFVLATLGCSAEVSGDRIYKEHTFSALVKDVRLQSLLLQAGKKNSDYATVTVPAVLFDPPIRIEDVRTEKENYGKEIDFLIEYGKANIEGTREEIISFWCPEERGDLEKRLGDSELFNKNRAYMVKMPGFSVIGLVKHEDTISILNGMNSMLIGITLKQSGDQLCLVRGPVNDMELAIIEASIY